MGYDCSVYAVAYATELALNNAPGLQAPLYTQQMRDHLAEVEQFPRNDTREHGRQRKVTILFVDDRLGCRSAAVTVCCSLCDVINNADDNSDHVYDDDVAETVLLYK